MAGLKIVRTVFQEIEESNGDRRPRLVVVLDLEEHATLTTDAIPGLVRKMEAALPGVFPDGRSPLVHTCGGQGTGIAPHSLKEEIASGTGIAHLFEHVLLHLLSRRSQHCAGFCGQRSEDLAREVVTHWYIVLGCPSKLEAVVAVDLAFDLVRAWADGLTPTLNPDALLSDLQDAIRPMLT